MSDLLKKIELLEHEVAHLTEERRFAMTTLEMAANLITFDAEPADLSDLDQTLNETAGKILSMLSFEAICFYLINEEDASFCPAYCEPAEYQPAFEKMVDQLIEDHTFAWALGRNKAVRVQSEHAPYPLLLHALATASRTRGMFLGIPIEGLDEFESPLPLLTLVLHSCANILESFDRYHRMRLINRNLEQNISDLHQRQDSNEKSLRQQQKTLSAYKQSIVEELELLKREVDRLLETSLTPAQSEAGDRICRQVSVLRSKTLDLSKDIPPD